MTWLASWGELLRMSKSNLLLLATVRAAQANDSLASTPQGPSEADANGELPIATLA